MPGDDIYVGKTDDLKKEVAGVSRVSLFPTDTHTLSYSLSPSLLGTTHTHTQNVLVQRVVGR